MKNKIAIILSGSLLLLIVSCNVKSIEKYNEDFKGEWRTEVYYSPTKADSIRNFLNVDGRDGGFGVACDKNDPFEECLFFQTGRVKINKSTKAIQFGNSVSQIHYVTQEPFINDFGKWELSLDSIRYFKY
ncbi:hypothetical protein ERX46_06920 [Brumimicrobium glaciale]|jgi:hypothetical protein|uniref:Lipocalin-like domain-containing protein n=1 Tax=Brumimicrobium glaciale TaxID=200475 RepID=A0A4Q4KP27_9FLAO|nr:hypothetical protein [Brumimicrobium glaciale]RYM35102.1 hypothetical protein ERX46_06920 [Brumimicrobium glaciale]